MLACCRTAAANRIGSIRVTKQQRQLVVRRWGFWYEGKPAIVAVVSKVRPGKAWVRFTEVASYLNSTPLPKRLDFENRVRRQVEHEIKRTVGSDWEIVSHFEGKLGDGREVFGRLSHHHSQHG